MATFPRMPIYLRAGDGPDIEIGYIEASPTGDGTVSISRSDIADFLREAADAFENAPAEEVPDAPA